PPPVLENAQHIFYVRLVEYTPYFFFSFCNGGHKQRMKEIRTKVVQNFCQKFRIEGMNDHRNAGGSGYGCCRCSMPDLRNTEAFDPRVSIARIFYQAGTFIFRKFDNHETWPF